MQASPTTTPIGATPVEGTAQGGAGGPNGSRKPDSPLAVGGAPALKEAPAVAQRLAVERLSAWYGKTQAIRDVSMHVQPNRVTAIIGPSGCGKSTLIRCLNRMHEVVRGARVAGHVFLDGEDIYAPDVDPVQVRRLIGMVFQKPNPFPMMSVYDNVVAGLRLTGTARRGELDAVVERSLRAVALWDEVKYKLQASGAALSGGQQQRLCIARALAMEPEIVLMDEPCSALDPIATYKIEELIVELKTRYTIAIVTHNMQQASRVSDACAFMLAGQDRVGELVEFGETRRIFTNPRDSRTEDYITGRFG
ncbi:MAG: phosphate ABC transporter ATP-binding protein [Chloroflexi bacterium]|nr:phosphate ABC transporter ATP-binding protein [Chloroflexota bacterium]